MQPSSTPDRCQHLISTAGREVIDCLRLNGLRVGLEEVGQSTEVHLTQSDGTDLPTVRFDQADEREAMVALATTHCSNGQWVRMSYYDGLPLESIKA